MLSSNEVPDDWIEFVDSEIVGLTFKHPLEWILEHHESSFMFFANEQRWSANYMITLGQAWESLSAEEYFTQQYQSSAFTINQIYYYQQNKNQYLVAQVTTNSTQQKSIVAIIDSVMLAPRPEMNLNSRSPGIVTLNLIDLSDNQVPLNQSILISILASTQHLP